MLNPADAIEALVVASPKGLTLKHIQESLRVAGDAVAQPAPLRLSYRTALSLCVQDIVRHPGYGLRPGAFHAWQAARRTR